MELANTRYAQWCAQRDLEPELRQELAAMQGDEEKIVAHLFGLYAQKVGNR